MNGMPFARGVLAFLAPVHHAYSPEVGSALFMARHTEQLENERGKPQNGDQSRAWQHIARVFGRKPNSVRTVAVSGTQADACIFKLDWSAKKTLEFICARGVLIGIPPFKGK
jgi:hypothetical protein